MGRRPHLSGGGVTCTIVPRKEPSSMGTKKTGNLRGENETPIEVKVGWSRMGRRALGGDTKFGHAEMADRDLRVLS